MEINPACGFDGTADGALVIAFWAALPKDTPLYEVGGIKQDIFIKALNIAQENGGELVTPGASAPLVAA